MIWAVPGGVLADGLVRATAGGPDIGGVLAEGLLPVGAVDTFLGRVLAEGLLPDTAGGIVLVVEVGLAGTPVI